MEIILNYEIDSAFIPTIKENNEIKNYLFILLLIFLQIIIKTIFVLMID